MIDLFAESIGMDKRNLLNGLLRSNGVPNVINKNDRSETSLSQISDQQKDSVNTGQAAVMAYTNLDSNIPT